MNQHRASFHPACEAGVPGPSSLRASRTPLQPPDSDAVCSSLLVLGRGKLRFGEESHLLAELGSQWGPARTGRVYPSSACRQAHGRRRLSAAVRGHGLAQRSRGKWHTSHHPPGQSRHLQSRKGRGAPMQTRQTPLSWDSQGAEPPGRNRTCGRSSLGPRSMHPAFLGRGPPTGDASMPTNQATRS